MLNIINKERELAKKLIEHSCNINSNEKVLIIYSNTPSTFIENLIEEIQDKKAIAIPLFCGKITEIKYFDRS